MTTNTADCNLVRPTDASLRTDNNNTPTIRPFEASDQQECREIFTLGMEQLIGLVTHVVFPRYLRYAVVLALIAILPAVTSSSWTLFGIFALVCVITLAALYINVYMECWKFINDCLTTDLWDIEKSYMKSAGSQMFIAEWKGKIVGMAGLVHNETHVPDQVELQRMSVSTEFRGLGIARKLLDSLLEFAKEQKYEKMILATTSAQKPAISLYKKHGFKLYQVFPYPQRILADLEYYCFELPL